ncbi:MAG TPA: hypothetical protein VK818_08935 [Methylomirabilota bacterium]|nr:hypothetical protein [Methylomirabilota bacterium]
MNLQTRKADSLENQTNFYVVVPIETAVNRAVFGDFAIRCDEEFPRYSRLELRSCVCKLGLRHNPVVIRVEFGKLCRVPDRKRQRNLQTISTGADGEAA